MPRRRWIQVGGELLEVSRDYVAPDRQLESLFILGDKNYQGLRSPIDGADISTRTKHHNYMKQKGLALTDDFKSHWAKAERERVGTRNLNTVDPTRKADLRRAVEQNLKRN